MIIERRSTVAWGAKKKGMEPSPNAIPVKVPMRTTTKSLRGGYLRVLKEKIFLNLFTKDITSDRQI